MLASDREISNQHRITVSSHVGSNWRHLGNELGGFSNSQMDQLEEKFKAQLIPFDEMICQLILKWENHSQIKPTIGKLAQALFKCQMNSALLALIALEKFNWKSTKVYWWIHEINRVRLLTITETYSMGIEGLEVFEY